MSIVPVLSYDYTLKMKINRLKIIYHITEVQALQEQQESNKRQKAAYEKWILIEWQSARHAKKILGRQNYYVAVFSDFQNKSMSQYTLLSPLLFLCNNQKRSLSAYKNVTLWKYSKSANMF